jgi:hypothetical protein
MTLTGDTEAKGLRNIVESYDLMRWGRVLSADERRYLVELSNAPSAETETGAAGATRNEGETMPYINAPLGRRSDLSYGYATPESVGELTYVLFKHAKDYGEHGDYRRHAEVIAALDNAKEEYRRRFLNPYEDAKREENGDV